MHIKTVIRTGIMFLFKLFPLKKRVFFSSFGGRQKSDSPLQIYRYMKKKYPETEVIFHWKRRKGDPIYFICYKIKFLFLQATSKVVVDNLSAGNMFPVNKRYSRRTAEVCSRLSGRRNQKYVTTWHGSPLKRIERDMKGSTISDCIIRQPMYAILGNTYTADILRHICFGKTQVELLGSARNDLLVNRTKKSIIAHKKKLGLPQNKMVALYAPTFRSNTDMTEKYVKPSGIEQISLIQFDKLFRVLAEKFNGEWVFVCRFHHMSVDKVDWERLEAEYSEQFINGNRHADIAEYLLCSDILITDYSSCMFDYAILNRPIFLLCHDLEHYKNEERGFYMDINSLPFPVAESFDELCNHIRNFDSDVYLEKLAQMKQKMGFCENGDATAKAGDFIYKLLEDT